MGMGLGVRPGLGVDGALGRVRVWVGWCPRRPTAQPVDSSSESYSSPECVFSLLNERPCRCAW